MGFICAWKYHDTFGKYNHLEDLVIGSMETR